MPRELFDSSHPRPPRTRWSFVVTPLVHVLVIASAVIAPLATGELPRIREHLVGVVPVEVQPPAPPAGGSIRGAVRSSAAPVNAPAAISDEPDEPRSVSIGEFRELGAAEAGPLGLSGGSPVVSELTPPPAPAPAPPRPAPVRVGGLVRGPQRIAGGPPRYPGLAQLARIEGNVVLDAVIDENGIVRDLRLLRSIPLLDQAALDAVRQWRYTPTLLNGVPVPVIMTVTVTFRLQ